LITPIISAAELPFLLQAMLNPDYGQCLTIEAVLSHQFLTGAVLEW
jgi:hypothetical protein